MKDSVYFNVEVLKELDDRNSIRLYEVLKDMKIDSRTVRVEDVEKILIDLNIPLIPETEGRVNRALHRFRIKSALQKINDMNIDTL